MSMCASTIRADDEISSSRSISLPYVILSAAKNLRRIVTDEITCIEYDYVILSEAKNLRRWHTNHSATEILSEAKDDMPAVPFLWSAKIIIGDSRQ